jgi:hypothetical protein
MPQFDGMLKTEAPAETGKLVARVRHLIANPLVFLLMSGILPCVGRADFTKTIQVTPGVQVNAVTTWYYSNCTTSLGLGSYTVNVAPQHGTLSFGDISGPVPGCPPGSPSLPAAAAYYTWTDTTGATTDYFQLYFELNGSVAEIIDISVVLAEPECTITSVTVATVPGIANSRTTIGIGEVVNLTTAVPVTWAITSGNGMLPQQCSSPIDACTFTAPYSNDTTTITATLADGSTSCSKPFTILQPTGLLFQRVQSPPPTQGNTVPVDYWFHNFFLGISYNIGMTSAVFITPGNVSFANVHFLELDGSTQANPPSDLLFTIPLNATTSTNGWLLRCDKDKDYSAESPDPKSSQWIFIDPTGTQKTPFSIVQTEWLHPLFGGYQYSKGQIAALSANGTFVATPDTQAAILTLPNGTPEFYKWIVPNNALCQEEVEAQFTQVAPMTMIQ